MSRACGECAACCNYPKIAPLEKPGITDCQHFKVIASDRKTGTYHVSGQGNNCGNYANRPAVCRDYACLWLAGYGDAGDRPDKTGMLLDTVHRIEGAFEAKPLWSGADQEPAGVAAIERMVKSYDGVALVTTFKETQLKRVVK